jgi:hypothetical protein
MKCYLFFYSFQPPLVRTGMGIFHIKVCCISIYPVTLKISVELSQKIIWRGHFSQMLHFIPI